MLMTLFSFLMAGTQKVPYFHRKICKLAVLCASPVCASGKAEDRVFTSKNAKFAICGVFCPPPTEAAENMCLRATLHFQVLAFLLLLLRKMLKVTYPKTL